MQKNTRFVVIALALVGVYLFGVMTGAVGTTLSRVVGGHMFGVVSGPVGPGAMMDGRFAGRGAMLRGWDEQELRAPAPDGRAYPGCPGPGGSWDEVAPGGDTRTAPDERGYGPGMMSPDTWRR